MALIMNELMFLLSPTPAHIQLDGVVRCPNSPTARRLNIEKVIDFLKLEGVVFQGDPVRGQRKVIGSFS